MLLRKVSLFPYLLFLFLVCDPLGAIALSFKSDDDDALKPGPLVTKDQWRTVVSTDSGQISAVDINDGYGGPYHLELITLEPNSLFLPVLLQTDMVFYVHTGSGSLSSSDRVDENKWVASSGNEGRYQKFPCSVQPGDPCLNIGRGRVGWVDEDDMNHMVIQKGDIYRLESGSIFYMQSYEEHMRDKLSIYALFTNSQETFIGAYTNLSDLVLGFDKRVLQMAFKVSEKVVEEITKAEKPPSIVHMKTKRKRDDLYLNTEAIEALIDGYNLHSHYKSKRTLNLFRKDRDFENYNGWSLAVNSRDFRALRGSDIGVFMINLNKGSMMGPHWNSRATEIAIVTNGQGMIHMVCSSSAPHCMNTRFRVKEGDVFTVPPFHSMAQMSFNNDSLVLMGFTTMATNNQPQFLAGKRSVFKTIDEDILAMSFNVPSTIIRQFHSSERQQIILECASCAEDEEKKMEEEIERQRQEEEARKKKEEEEARKRQEEEEARKREEEERKRKEEARKKQEEEARKRKEEEEEEARKKQEEEERKRKEDEEARKKQEEEEARKKQEEESRKKQEEEETRKKQEEEARKKQEEEEARNKQEEEARKREEEERKRKEEEEARKREEEEKKRKEEEEERKRKEEEEARKREEEERKKKEEEEARKREEEERKRKEEEEEKNRKEEEEEEARKKQEEAEARKREEERKRKEEEARRKQEEEEARKREEEERRRREEEARKKKEEEEEEKEKGVWKILLLALLQFIFLVVLISYSFSYGREGWRRQESMEEDEDLTLN